MKRIQVIVRDIQRSAHCKPKVLDFTIEGAHEDLSIVLGAVEMEFPTRQYEMELTSEETIYHALNPDLSITKA